MVHEDWLELISAYIDGECSAEQARSVEGHLAECTLCHERYVTLDGLHRRQRLMPVAPQGALDEAAVAALVGATRARRRQAPMVAAAAALLLAGAATTVVLATGNDPESSERVANSDMPGTPSDRPSSAAATIATSHRGFNSPEVRIAAGETVAWTNDETVDHELVVQLPGAAISDELVRGGRVEVTFEDPGDYHYYCQVHDGMDGAVVVTE